MERSVETIQNDIKAMIKQREDREADLRRHVTRQCRCVKYSKHRCKGHQAAIVSVINEIRGQICELRREEIKAITREKAKGYDHEAKIQVSGAGKQPVQDGQKVQGTDCPNQ